MLNRIANNAKHNVPRPSRFVDIRQVALPVLHGFFDQTMCHFIFRWDHLWSYDMWRDRNLYIIIIIIITIKVLDLGLKLKTGLKPN